MKIEEIEFVYKKIPLERSFATATGGVSNSSSFFVRISTDEGIVGYGCGYPTSGTGEDVKSATYFSNLFKQDIFGMNPIRIESINSVMDSITYGNPAVKFAFNTALWDIFGKAHDSPLYMLLGYNRPKIPTSITIGLNDRDTMLKEARYWHKKGFSHLKVKLGADADAGLDVLSSIRAELGPDVNIRADANGSLALNDARRLVGVAKDLDIEFLEQPVSDEGGMVELTETSPIRIMADELIGDKYHLPRLLGKRAFHLANIKLNRFGGITNALRMIDCCELFEVPCMLGCMSENAISISASLHLALAHTNVKYVDLDTFLFLKHQPAKGLNIKKGIMRPSSSPGLGLEVDERIFKKA
ncbi:MAG: dipeptide epimerase [Candidatus Methanofastidiosa archaeon]|nr:dipeptide epimerase [Candidatus Methanofastidiosa archaeon]